MHMHDIEVFINQDEEAALLQNAGTTDEAVVVLHRDQIPAVYRELKKLH